MAFQLFTTCVGGSTRGRARGLSPPRPGTRPDQAAEDEVRPPRGPPARLAGGKVPRPTRHPTRPRLNGDSLPERIRRPARPNQPAAARPQAARETSRSALGRLPHVPPHLRLAPSQARHQPPPTQPRPRPPLACIHLDPLHASPAGRRGTGSRPATESEQRYTK